MSRPIVDLPDFVLTLALESRYTPARPGGTVSRSGPMVQLGQPITAGGRNAGLASVTGQLITRGFEDDELQAAVLQYNAELVQPPLGEAEVRKIVASVLRSRANAEATA